MPIGSDHLEALLLTKYLYKIISVNNFRVLWPVLTQPTACGLPWGGGGSVLKDTGLFPNHEYHYSSHMTKSRSPAVCRTFWICARSKNCLRDSSRTCCGMIKEIIIKNFKDKNGNLSHAHEHKNNN